MEQRYDNDLLFSKLIDLVLVVRPAPDGVHTAFAGASSPSIIISASYELILCYALVALLQRKWPVKDKESVEESQPLPLPLPQDPVAVVEAPTTVFITDETNAVDPEEDVIGTIDVAATENVPVGPGLCDECCTYMIKEGYLLQI